MGDFMKLLSAIITLLVFLAAHAVAAPAETPEELAQQIQQRYQNVTSLSFSFVQQTTGQLAGRPKSGSGDAFLFKSGYRTMMRWNYQQPEEQVIISDGSSVSMYFASLNQLIIAPADTAQSDILVSFFTGDRALDESFLILPPEPEPLTDLAGHQQELRGIQLIPRQPHAQIRSVHLFIGPDSLINRIDMLDHFDTRTIIDLHPIAVDPFNPNDDTIIERFFSFTPPAGTEIIRQ